MDEVSTPKPIADLFGNYTLPPVGVKKRTSERAELVRYFYENAKVGWQGKGKLSPGYVGMRLAHLTVQDLYAFKSMCEDRRRTGYNWSKYFWGSLKSQPWQQNSSLVGA